MIIRRQSFVRLYYHYVWATKDREPLISPRIEELIRKSFSEKSVDLNIKILENDGIEDHTHVLVSAPADIAEHLKGASSHYLNTSAAGLNFRWQGGYGVVTVSPDNLAAVRWYIRRQKEHYRNGTLNGLLESDSAIG
ncbi:MAG TPA: IS200/IS605 family transposase [Bacteroidota bacterium]|nr:IS200/IS605 family transposase [Bacteroidota bacterium]